MNCTLKRNSSFYLMKKLSHDLRKTIKNITVNIAMNTSGSNDARTTDAQLTFVSHFGQTFGLLLCLFFINHFLLTC